MISISIVSHGQYQLVRQVLDDLSRLEVLRDIEVIVTVNIPEVLIFDPIDFPWPVKIIINKVPKGFGENHNAAFHLSAGKWFCVLNPDIRIPDNPFPAQLDEMGRQSAAVIAPAVLDPDGLVEDNARHFPSPLALASKMLGGADGRYSYAIDDNTFTADWVAGMFMLFRAEDYQAVGGFDEDFFLYYEDVDICARLWKAGRSVLVCPRSYVVHDARRASRNSLRYMYWHAASMVRYFCKHFGRLPKSGVA